MKKDFIAYLPGVAIALLIFSGAIMYNRGSFRDSIKTELPISSPVPTQTEFPVPSPSIVPVATEQNTPVPTPTFLVKPSVNPQILREGDDD